MHVSADWAELRKNDMHCCAAAKQSCTLQRHTARFTAGAACVEGRAHAEAAVGGGAAVTNRHCRQDARSRPAQQHAQVQFMLAAVRHVPTGCRRGSHAISRVCWLIHLVWACCPAVKLRKEGLAGARHSLTASARCGHGQCCLDRSGSGFAATPRISVRRSLRRSAGRLSSRASLRGGGWMQEGVSRERPAAMAALTPVMTEPPEQLHHGDAWRQQEAEWPQQQVHSTQGTTEICAAASCFDHVPTEPAVNGELPPVHMAAPTVISWQPATDAPALACAASALPELLTCAVLPWTGGSAAPEVRLLRAAGEARHSRRAAAVRRIRRRPGRWVTCALPVGPLHVLS
jgi:hypothetical protein